MKNKTLVLLVGVILFSFNAIADQVLDEQRYFAIQERMAVSSVLPDQVHDKLLIDALEDLANEPVSALTYRNILAAVRRLDHTEFALADQIRLVALEQKLGGFSFKMNAVAAVLKPNLTRLNERATLEYMQNRDVFKALPFLTPQAIQKFEGFDLVRAEPTYNPVTAAQLQDLFFKTPELEKYKNGAYSKVPRIFKFCSHVRPYACLMLLKDANGNPVYNADGTLWSHPSLGYARSGNPFHKRSGYTPSGVYEINGVMPAADQQTSFGKFRRLIIDFVPKSTNETNYTYLLPPSHWDSKWWLESKVARDAGRNLFRIHGTGKKNTDSSSTFRPFVATSGCIAQRENTYDGVTYKDQRVLLDKLMVASGLEPKFENETKIKALLYLVEVKNTKGAVDLRLLNSLGLR